MTTSHGIDDAEGRLDGLNGWLEANWDPELTLAAWWDRLGRSGWAAPMLPADRFGLALGRLDALRAARAISEFGAVGAPIGLGLGMAAPTIAVHGTPEQVTRFVGPIVTGRSAWCQLFSEPGAGSDLAGLSTRAVRDGDAWIVNGQKVWTSGAQLADVGMLLARTNPAAPKHRGLTWFALDMHQPGVEVRPLRQMTGGTNFSEVFLTDVVVHDDARIGDLHGGWAVANTTLAYERAGMGAGGTHRRGAPSRTPAPSRGSSGAARVTSSERVRRASRARPGPIWSPRPQPTTSGLPSSAAATATPGSVSSSSSSTRSESWPA